MSLIRTHAIRASRKTSLSVLTPYADQAFSTTSSATSISLSMWPTHSSHSSSSLPLSLCFYSFTTHTSRWSTPSLVAGRLFADRNPPRPSLTAVSPTSLHPRRWRTTSCPSLPCRGDLLLRYQTLRRVEVSGLWLDRQQSSFYPRCGKKERLRHLRREAFLIKLQRFANFLKGFGRRKAVSVKTSSLILHHC